MIFSQAKPALKNAENGRVAQRQRTRLQLLQAARDLRATGRVPSVADVADATGISRTTAYRYFPTQETLLAEASAEPLIEAVREAINQVRSESDVIKRVDAVFVKLGPTLLKHEAELRTLLKIALENSLEEVHRRHVPLLSARWVIAWDGILEPIRRRLSPKKYAVMVRALGSLLSIETLTVLRDACDFDDAATINALRSSARAMVTGLVADLPKRKSK